MTISSHQNAIKRYGKEVADLQKKISSEKEKEAKIYKDISNLTSQINRSKTGTTLKTKMSRLVTLNKNLSSAQNKVAEYQKKLSGKQHSLQSEQVKLDKALKQNEKKNETDRKKVRQLETKHQNFVTSSLRTQVLLHNEMKESPLMIDLAKLPEKITVLFFAANPKDQHQLKLDEEIRDVMQKIRASEHRDAIELKARWAVRSHDLLQSLNEENPHIVHFSGHGSMEDEIIFMDDKGNAKPVTKNAIVQLINATSENIRLVLFNTCYSSNQAAQLTNYVDFAIGMNTSIGDEAARVFAANFYSALGFSASVQKAFDQAKVALMIEGIPEESTPELFSREGINAGEIILVKP
ncbi:CHAT domain-containing protein [Halobacillus halophilus]|nr:CHAT domain-containing protein [Halobacillus halophilus]